MHKSNWQPIETAPMDGTEVLVYGPPCIVRMAISHGDGWYSLPGYWHVYPTHWQPRPKPPEDET